MAHALGADYIEQDVVATRDGVLLVLHDIYLEQVTDVAQHYPNRARDDGHYYVIDFDLAELQSLRILERAGEDPDQALYPERFPRGLGRFRISTLDEELELIAGMNRSTGRLAGIYPEIKDPQWHEDHGIDLAHLLLTALEAHGFQARESAAFVQCFDKTELRRVREGFGARLKLVQLLNRDDEMGLDALSEIATYADGVGMPYGRLVDVEDGAMRPTRVCREAQDLGLVVHPYTFRKDQLPPFADNFERLLAYFLAEIGVDGLFCDHPDVAVGVRAELGLD